MSSRRKNPDFRPFYLLLGGIGVLFILVLAILPPAPQQIILTGVRFQADFTYDPPPIRVEDLGERSRGYISEVSIFPSDVSVINVQITITMQIGFTMKYSIIHIRPIDDPTGVASTIVFDKTQPAETTQITVSGTVPNTDGDYYWDIGITSHEEQTTGHGGHHVMGLRGTNPSNPMDLGAVTMEQVGSSTEVGTGKDFTPPDDAQLVEGQTFKLYYDRSPPTVYIKGYSHISHVRVFYQLEVKYRKDTSEFELFTHDYASPDWNNYYDATTKTYKRSIPEFKKPYEIEPQPDVQEIFDGETGWPEGELDLYLKATVTTYYAAGSDVKTVTMSVQLTYTPPFSISINPIGIISAIVVISIIYRKRRINS